MTWTRWCVGVVAMIVIAGAGVVAAHEGEELLLECVAVCQETIAGWKSAAKDALAGLQGCAQQDLPEAIRQRDEVRRQLEEVRAQLATCEAER